MAMLVQIPLAAASFALLAAGARTLLLERRIARRLERTRTCGTADAAGNAGGTGGALRAASHLTGSSDRAEIERDLAAAGFADPRAPAIFALLRLAAALGAGVATILLLIATDHWTGRTRLLAIPATGVTWVLAKLALHRLAAARSRHINEQLPFVLDLMTMMLESGISLDQCFRTLAGPEGSAAPALQQAMAALVEETQLGLSYDQALRRWADRLGVSGAHELAGLLRQSLYHGAELGGSLREFAREFTARRVAAARESIGRKTTSMALVMMIFMMPALFIMLCGPAVVTLSATLNGARR